MLDRIRGGVSGALLFLAGAAIFAMMLHICADVAARMLWGMPLEGTLEYVSTYYMTGCVLGGMAAMQRAGSQVIVEVFLQKLSPARLRRFDTVALILTAAYVAFLAWAGMDEAITAMRQNDFLSLPSFDLIVWPSRWFVPVGFAGMLCVMALPKPRDGRSDTH